MKSPPVCIDTQVCIWGIKAQAKPGHQDEQVKIARAQQLFTELSKDKITVCLPAIVLAELLIHEVGTPNLEKLRDDLCKRFIILVFNTMCAQRHAEVVAKNCTEKELERIRQLDPTLTKAKLKADFQIVSTMLGNGIKVLYTEDNGLAHIARQAGLTVNGLPGLQLSIFDIAKAPAAKSESEKLRPTRTPDATTADAAPTVKGPPEVAKPTGNDGNPGTNSAASVATGTTASPSKSKPEAASRSAVEASPTPDPDTVVVAVALKTETPAELQKPGASPTRIAAPAIKPFAPQGATGDSPPQTQT